MEIEQKERERIWRKCGPDNINNGFGHDPDHGVDTAIEEHLHLQKEVIQPLRKDMELFRESAKDMTLRRDHYMKKSEQLEAEIKAMRNGLSLARS